MAAKVRVFFYRGFLTEEECDHLTSLGKGTLEVDSNSGDADGKKQLASSEYVLDVPDPVVAGIEERISAWTFLPRENSHPIKVSRYGSERVGEKLDYLGEKSRSETRDSLLATVILYLSNTTQGGEIHFPESEARNRIWPDCSKTSSILRPIRGNVVLFFTRHLNTSVDQTSIHVRCPVLEGEMWVGTKLFYVRPPPKQIRGTTEQKNSECTDEDESCSRWAALGECLKNPVYMIGTPDYSGACRKSCKAC
ncbi:PREDICTED: probable prolyl 4-hydroxylase 12 isoform X2 [Tarenaya hassleriana]|uniref:probable prolyl 4-hydroxylase 12 isoform X2 n=1 Tax=Tarenaya hassleriana TaxID=28532 RepID=UPI00053C864C|nr:PREDICTED: probable prolyl 4-hydroxylase 12 isoform X2 [Tarenaya hassleriana]